jgi:hypothetical protein
MRVHLRVRPRPLPPCLRAHGAASSTLDQTRANWAIFGSTWQKTEPPKTKKIIDPPQSSLKECQNTFFSDDSFFFSDTSDSMICQFPHTTRAQKSVWSRGRPYPNS